MSATAILVTTDGAVAAGSVLFRFRGQLALSIVVKASFQIDPSGKAVPAPSEIVPGELTFERSPVRSVEHAGDLAPYKPRCDVTFVGHAHAPGGRPTTQAATRLAIVRDDGHKLVDRALHVLDRAPFTSVPLVYERAIGGPGEPNPYGTETPTVVDPTDARKAGSYAPVSRFSPARKQLVKGIDRRALEGALLELPETIAWDYFQSAPRDQQCEYPRGGEWLVLDGVHPTLPRVQLRLPAARGAARLGPHDGFAAAARSIEMVCDTIAVDGDRMSLAMVWRGRAPAVPDEESLRSMRIAAALEWPGVPVDWAKIAEGSAREATTSRGLGPALSGATVGVDEAAVMASAAGVIPFVGAGSAPSSNRPSTAATPWGGQLQSHVVPASAGEETMAAPPRAPLSAPYAPASEVGEGTFALRPGQHAVAAQRAIAPFAVSGPTSPRAAPPGPGVGLPFGGSSAASPALPAAAAVGEETLAVGSAPLSMRTPFARPPTPPLMQAVVAPPPVMPPPTSPPIPSPAPAAPPPAAAPPAARPPAPPPRAAAPPPRVSGAVTPATRPAQRPAPAPAKPASLADSLRAAGASANDVSSLMSALAPPPPPPPPEDTD